MPRVRRRALIQHALTLEQIDDLCLGMSGGFSLDSQRQAAWYRHRDELLAGVNLGTRPQAFWDYEMPKSRMRGESDFECLRRLGLLTAREREFFETEITNGTKKQ